MTVFCLIEPDGDAVADASLRALTLGRGLAAGAATGVACVVFGALNLAVASGLAAYGAADVYVVSGVDGYAPQAWARALAELLADAGTAPHAVVAAGTEHGNEVLAHLGAITGLPMAANCVAAAPADGTAGGLVLALYPLVPWAGAGRAGVDPVGAAAVARTRPRAGAGVGQGRRPDGLHA